MAFTPVKASNPGLKITAIHFRCFKGDKGPIWSGKIEIGNAFWFYFDIKSKKDGGHFVTFFQEKKQKEVQPGVFKTDYYAKCGIIDTEYETTIKNGIISKFNNGDPKDYVGETSNYAERTAKYENNSSTKAPANNAPAKDEAFD
jgi:hypothetical protein